MEDPTFGWARHDFAFVIALLAPNDVDLDVGRACAMLLDFQASGHGNQAAGSIDLFELLRQYFAERTIVDCRQANSRTISRGFRQFQAFLARSDQPMGIAVDENEQASFGRRQAAERLVDRSL